MHGLGGHVCTPMCFLVNRRSCCVSQVTSCVVSAILDRARGRFGLAIACKTSASITGIVGTTGHCPVVSRCRIMIMGRTRDLGHVRRLTFCLRGPRGSAVLIMYCGRNDVSHQGGLTTRVRGGKILFRSQGLGSDRVPNFVSSCLGQGGIRVRPGTSRVVTRFMKTSLGHVTNRLRGLVLALPRNTHHVAPRRVRQGVNVDGSCGGFRLQDTLIRGSILGTGGVVGCFRRGPGGGPLRVALTVLFGFFSGLVLTCCTPRGSSRKVTTRLNLGDP